MSKKKSPIKPPYVFINAQQKTGGKTTFATFTIDALTLNGVDTRVQQIDDQRRLSDMLGSVVEDLRPSREAVFEELDDPQPRAGAILQCRMRGRSRSLRGRARRRRQ